MLRCAEVCHAAISVPKSSPLGYSLLVRKPLLLEAVRVDADQVVVEGGVVDLGEIDAVGR